MPDILTTSFAAEVLKRTWVDLMLCVAMRKKWRGCCKFAEHNYTEGILSLGGDDHEAGN